MADISVATIRREGRLRVAYLTLVAGTLSALYLGTSFPWFLAGLLALGTPVDHIISAGLLYALISSAVWIMLEAILRWRIPRANLDPIHIPRIRRQVYRLGRKLGIKVVTLTSGGFGDKKLSALTLGQHMAVRIGRGALKTATRDADGFKFQIAHELVHLASNDPRRDQTVLAVYISTFLAVCASFGLSLIASAQDLMQAAKLGGFSWFMSSWNSTVCFAISANTVAFGGIMLVLWLENQSAKRIREFHADALAALTLGFTAKIFNDHKALSSFVFHRLLKSHPEDAIRQSSIEDIATVFRADKILFFIQGYFGTLILELLLQALFSTATTNLASVVERRSNLDRFLDANFFVTVATICLFSVLVAAAHTLIVARLAITISTLRHLSRGDRMQMLVSIPLLVGAGAALCLGTSISILYDLKQLKWDLITYFLAASDRLFVHGTSLFVLYAVLAITISRAKQILVSPRLLVILGIAPIVFTLGFGAAIYL